MAKCSTTISALRWSIPARTACTVANRPRSGTSAGGSRGGRASEGIIGAHQAGSALANCDWPRSRIWELLAPSRHPCPSRIFSGKPDTIRTLPADRGVCGRFRDGRDPRAPRGDGCRGVRGTADHSPRPREPNRTRPRLHPIRSTGASDSGRPARIWSGWSRWQATATSTCSRSSFRDAPQSRSAGWAVAARRGPDRSRQPWGARALRVDALSSTARKLVEAVPGSLLLVPADGDRRDGCAARYRRIMVPLDGSARAESVLPIATRLAKAHEAELLIAHVTPAPELTKVGPLTAQDLELEQRVIARNERVARSYLDQIRARLIRGGHRGPHGRSPAAATLERGSRDWSGGRAWISSSSRPTGGGAHGIFRAGAWRPIC